MADDLVDRNLDRLLRAGASMPRMDVAADERLRDRLAHEAARLRGDLGRPAEPRGFRFGVAAAAAIVVVAVGLAWGPRGPTCVLHSVAPPLRVEADRATRLSVSAGASGGAEVFRGERRIATLSLFDGAEVVVEPDATPVVSAYAGFVRVEADAPVRIVAASAALGLRPGAAVAVEWLESGETSMKSWIIPGGVGAAVGAAIVAIVLERGDASLERPASRPVDVEVGKRLVVEVPASRPVGQDERDRKLLAADRRIAELEKKLAAAKKDADKFAAELVQKKGVTIESIQARLAELRKAGAMSVMLSSRTADLIADLKGLGPAGTQAVMELLKSEDAKDRFLAAKLLEDLKDPAAIPSLLEAALNDADNLAASMASHALALMEDPRAIDPMKQLVEKKRSWEQQVNALWGLVNLGDAWGLEQSIAYMNDPAVSKQARAALGANVAVFMHTPEVMPIVDRTVQDFYSNEQVMQIAVDYYRAVNSAVARDRLQAIVNDTRVPQAIRDAASQALSH